MRKLLSSIIFIGVTVFLAGLAYLAFPRVSNSPSFAAPQEQPVSQDAPNLVTTQFNWIALPLSDGTLVMASDLEANIESQSGVTVDAVQRWNAVAQGFDTYTPVPFPIGDFALAVGGPYRITVTSGGTGINWTLAGDVPDPSVFTYTLRETASSDFNWLMLPLDRGTLAMASDLKADIEANSDNTITVDAISKWNIVAQGFDTFTTVPFPIGDFAIEIGQPYRISVSNTSGAIVTWPAP